MTSHVVSPRHSYAYYAVFKPYGMLSQYTDDAGKPGLSRLYPFPPGVYPVGRLDADSEGLLLLTSDPRVNHRLLHPSHGHLRTYFIQVEGLAGAACCGQLAGGVTVNIRGASHIAQARSARIIDPPSWLPERIPPVRFRKTVPTSWLELTLDEGKNRQVRKMTAAAGYPTLRLVRTAIGDLTLEALQGKPVMEFSAAAFFKVLKIG
jgi:23S rRNA pseudouridine2457 synthase